MSFNQFTAVRIADDASKVTVSGESPELAGRGITQVRVAIAALPEGSDPATLLGEARFETADAALLLDGWSVDYPLDDPPQYRKCEKVLVVGSALGSDGTDLWADTFEIIGQDDHKPRLP